MLSAQLAHPAPNQRSRIVAFLGSRPWFLAYAVIAVWVFAPELRRLVDWHAGFSSISVISALPLLALVPFALAIFYTRRLQRLDRGTAACAWLWFGGFTFSLAIALAQRNLTGPVYAYALFCLPAAFGLWLATSRVDPAELYERVASFVLWLAAATSLYGVIQFASGPAWDMAWMKSANIVSIGFPIPFEFRPFSTLNSPGIFADFLTFAVLLNLPRLRSAKPSRIVPLIAVLGTLCLTMVRSDWIACAIGILLFTLLSPNRLRALTMFGVLGMICFVLVSNAASLLGSSTAGNDLSSRFSTLTDLNKDQSYNERQRYFGEALTDAAEAPFGIGLGVIGTAAKLGNSGATNDFDNGYIARFTELGYFGTLCYLGAIVIAFSIALRRWSALRRAGETNLSATAAACVAIQGALIALDLSSDHHDALPGVIFWMSIALVPSAKSMFAMVPDPIARQPVERRRKERALSQTA